VLDDLKAGKFAPARFTKTVKSDKTEQIDK
jgi:hypothetical protein